MDMEKIVLVLKEAKQNNTLVLYALAVFGVIVFVGWLISHMIACAKYKRTEMNGMIRVGITLNDWPENPPANAAPRLSYGTVLINMHDPATVRKGRLDPALNWREKASCREYEVIRLLERYCSTMENSCLQFDPGVLLLQRMLAGNHCTGLGRICVPSVRKGLEIRATTEKKQDKKNKNRLMVYKAIPDMLAQEFCNFTQCEAQNLCITLEYLPRN